MASETSAAEVEELELDLVLETIYRCAGYDFRDYARPSVRRRLWNVARREQVGSLAGLIDRLLYNPATLQAALFELAVSTTGLFRDPAFYQGLRTEVVPWLQTFPFIRVWVAGCSTGEEAYSLAILLQEEGLYARSRIYATDISEPALRLARQGAYPLHVMQAYTQNYLKSGARGALSDYYRATEEQAIFDPGLRANMVFAAHNLATDASFNEFNLMLCRNVMIYFGPRLQARVHGLLFDSLVPFGVLGLGDKETLRFTLHEHDYEVLDDRLKLYRKLGAASLGN
jgi:chemotaxis protein methyltransferase CheR